MISYNQKSQVFSLETKNISYIIGILKNRWLLHLHFGKKVKNFSYLTNDLASRFTRWSAQENDLIGIGTGDALALEFSTFGNADLRLPTLNLRYSDGSIISEFTYKSHKIYNGKPVLEGLPATYAEDGDKVQTLEIELFDNLKNVTVILLYSVFEDFDVITRSIRVINNSAENVKINHIMSATMDMQDAGDNYDIIHLTGAWARERSVNRHPIFIGNQEIYSRRGGSSNVHNPFFAMAEKSATELSGNVYGFNLIYSGCFTAGVECDTYTTTRAYIGLNPFVSGWTLEPNEAFQAPEAVLTFSAEGLSGMSRNFHKLYRTRLCRSKFRDTPRYTLINNWEGTYFNFTEEKILDIAKKGSEIGLDLMVLDDGWFGQRNNDRAGLGDWFVNKEKLPNGLDGLAKKVNELGMKFGLWFEPEMVNPDSDLYRAHPDWAIQVKGREACLGRNQMILDLSRNDVCEYITEAVSNVLKSANIEYVKWDMNRALSEFGSLELPADRQDELCHRYILGLYKVLETLTSRFPNVLWESCSGGGNRFDGGMLYYMPQIWTSDCSDAGERISIQYGTSMCYPFSAMGSHVSVTPNHQTGRSVSFKTRGDMAVTGQFGFELDMTKMSDEDINTARKQVAFYKKYSEVFHKGDLYRLSSPFESNRSALEFVSEDKNTVIVVYANKLCEVTGGIHNIKLSGLEENAVYTEVTEEDPQNSLTAGTVAVGREFGGDYLMYIGLKYRESSDFLTSIRIFRKK